MNEHGTQTPAPPSTSGTGVEPAAGDATGLVGFLLLALLLSFTGIFNHALWTPDEPRVAEIGRAMLASGDYLVPTLAGAPFLEKPPLYWWTMAGAFRVFGVSDGVARLPSAVFGFATVLLAYAMARRIAGRRAGALAGLALLTTIGFHHAHRAVTDPALAFFVTLGFWAFQRTAFPGPGDRAVGAASRPGPGPVLLVYLACGLAFLSKGIVGVGLLFGPIGLYILAARRGDLLRTRAHLPGFLLFAALCAAWPIGLWMRGGRELLDSFLLDNILYRFMASPDGQLHGGHEQPPWYYLHAALPAFMPWVLVLPALLRWLALERKRRALPPGLAFMTRAAPLGILLLSLPGTKRSLYLLPLLAPASVAAGVWLAGSTATDMRPWARGTLRLLFGALMLMLLLIGAAGAAVLARVPVLAGVGEAVRRGPGADLLAAALVAGSLAIGVALVRGRRTASRTVLGFCAVMLLINVVGYRLVDPAKDLEPFVRELEARGTFDSEVVGFRFDETTQAILGFHGQHVVRYFKMEEDLVAHLTRNPDAQVLMLERQKERLSRKLSARLRVVWSWALPPRRVYILCRLTPEQEPR